jgi:hypothetical protein
MFNTLKYTSLSAVAFILIATCVTLAEASNYIGAGITGALGLAVLFVKYHYKVTDADTVTTSPVEPTPPSAPAV